MTYLKSPIVSRSKLRPPTVFGNHMRRDRLMEHFSPGTRARVTLVQAPAGFGKTTLMHDAYVECGESAAWLTLDADDNDPARLLLHVLAALGASVSGTGDGPPTADVMAGPKEFDAPLRTALLSAPETLCLFIDEVDLLTEPDALAVIEAIIGHLPLRAALVLGSRITPRLKLGRLRMHGLSRKIGPRDLSFSRDEVAALFALRAEGRDIAPKTLDRIHGVTEGWIGALQMALLSSHSGREFDRCFAAFDGSNIELAEFLAEDFLDRLPESDREFLRDTSIFDDFSADLADHVLDRDDSARNLDRLWEANAFLSHAEETDWFRYHKLFRSFLRHQLKKARGPDDLRAMNRRAASWFDAHGLSSRAVSHALRAQDHDLAARIIDRAVMGFFRAGRLATVLGWMKALPQAMIERHPQSMLAYAWSLIALNEAPQLRRDLIDKLDSHKGLSAQMRSEILYLGPFSDVLNDDLDGIEDRCLAALATAAEISAFSRGVLWNIVCYGRIERHDYAAAAEAAHAACEAHLESGSPYGLSYAEGFLGQLELLRGRIASAKSCLRTVRRISEDSPEDTMSRICATMLELRIAHVTGQGAEGLRADPDLEKLIVRRAPPRDVIDYYIIQAETAVERGDSARGYGYLQSLRQVARDRSHERMEAISWAVQAQIAAGRGDVSAARDYLSRARSCPTMRRYSAPMLTLMEAVVAMKAGQPLQAADSVRAAIAEARKAGDVLDLVRLLLLEAEIATLMHRQADADQVLEAVLDMVQRERESGLVRRAPGALRERLQALGARRGLVLSVAPAQPEPDAAENGAPPDGGLLEPLSKREIDVLFELSKGLSNKAISERLSISLPTVKTHLRNINSKLTASNRTEAIATARRLGLLQIV